MLQDWKPCCHSMLFSAKHPASGISGQYRRSGTFVFSFFVLFSIAIHVNGQFHIEGAADQSTHSRRGENNPTSSETDTCYSPSGGKREDATSQNQNHVIYRAQIPCLCAFSCPL